MSRAQAARSCGYSANQFSALGLISIDGPITPVDLSARLTMTSGSVTALLDRLQHDDLIRREANPDDRRSILIHTTDRGEALLAASVSDFDRRVSTVADELDPEEREILDRLLVTLRHAFDALPLDHRSSMS